MKKKKYSCLAIIPARGNSKRIKNKNIINFLGKPIIFYSLDLIKEAKIFDKIHVSTDSKKIRGIVEKKNIKIDFLRSKKLADDKTGVLHVLKYVIDKYKSMNIYFDAAALIYPCSPLIKAKDLVNAYKIFKKNKLKFPILSVSEFNSPPERSLSIKKKFIKVDNIKKFKSRSQDIEKKFYDTGSFSIFPCNKIENIIENFRNNKPCYKFLPYFIERIRAIDINTYDDLNYAKLIYGLLKKKDLN